MGINPIKKIIIRILFIVTLFQHSPLTSRVFFISIRRERFASSVASGGQYRQYHLETLYKLFMIRNFLLGFLPLEGFPG